MWTATASTAATASPQASWRLFEDVAGWTNWSLADTACDVRPDAGCIDGTRFHVSHELQPLAAGGTRVTYAIKVDGPDAETLGPLVTADFAEVVAALKALAGLAEHPCEGAT